MRIHTLPTAMAAWSAGIRRTGGTVGFVPTMGALHAGHLALVRQALADGHHVVCSIYVNPLQFNDPKDLAAYPRQEEQDLALLGEAGCHAVFVPAQGSLFQGIEPRAYDLGGLDARWEGLSRPGHFQGVVNVVERLFHFVRPHAAYFGEKDRQQLAIIRHAARTLHWPERIVGCPTVREADGLAMSSRNARLGPDERRQAAVLHRALTAAAESLARGESLHHARQQALDTVATEPAVRLDHLGFADPDSLQPVDEPSGTQELVALIAAWVGPVRLIDNVTVRVGFWPDPVR
jgi:pantoate--beta-alanine ligase